MATKPLSALLKIMLGFCLANFAASPLWSQQVAVASADVKPPEAAPVTVAPKKAEPAQSADPTPFEFKPYEVRFWLFSDQPEYLQDWDFQSQFYQQVDAEVAGAWNARFEEIPGRFGGLVRREFGRLTFAGLSEDDLIMVVDASTDIGRPVRTPQIAADTLEEIPTTQEALAELSGSADKGVQNLLKKLKPVEGAGEAVLTLWETKKYTAMVMPRGLWRELVQRLPRGAIAPRVVELPVANQFTDIARGLDKLFMIRVVTEEMPMRVDVVEVDGPLKIVGPMMSETAIDVASLPAAAARAVFRAFGPIVRIESPGTNKEPAIARVRAIGLAQSESSPVALQVGDSLQPWQVKEERSGQLSVAILDWTYAVVTKVNNPRVEMEVHSGRAGGLQGKISKRTQRLAILCRSRDEPTTLRLHARGAKENGMAGYEVYERDLKTKAMTLIGRTNWDGRVAIEQTESPLRLLYIKNGGSVLARLPVVPGLFEIETADLIGDDSRLRAEAYLKGVENAIIDLVALRLLFAARIRARIDRRQVKEARELFEELRGQPTYSLISDDMSSKSATIRSKNSIEQKKIDGMFAKTRELLVSQINEKLIREVEIEVANAEKGIFPDPDAKKPPAKK